MFSDRRTKELAGPRKACQWETIPRLLQPSPGMRWILLLTRIIPTRYLPAGSTCTVHPTEGTTGSSSATGTSTQGISRATFTPTSMRSFSGRVLPNRFFLRQTAGFSSPHPPTQYHLCSNNITTISIPSSFTPATSVRPPELMSLSAVCRITEHSITTELRLQTTI